MNPMEFGTDILPSDAYQNFAFEIVQAHGNLSKLIEIIHEGPDRLGINDLGKLQVSHLPRRRKNIFQLHPDALLTLAQRLLFLLVLSYSFKPGIFYPLPFSFPFDQSKLMVEGYVDNIRCTAHIKKIWAQRYHLSFSDIGTHFFLIIYKIIPIPFFQPGSVPCRPKPIIATC